MNCISPTWYLVLLQGVLRILITEGTSGVLMWQWFFHAVWVLSSSRPLCQDRGDHIKKVREDSLFPLHRGRSETWRHSPGWPVLGLGEALQCSSPQATSSPAPAKVRWQQQCWGTCLRVVWPLRTLPCPLAGRNGSSLMQLRDACTMMWCWRTMHLYPHWVRLPPSPDWPGLGSVSRLTLLSSRGALFKHMHLGHCLFPRLSG